MQDIHDNAASELREMVSTMSTPDLEHFIAEMNGVLQSRKTNSSTSTELDLIKKFQNECTLPVAHWERFHALLEKKNAGTMTENDQMEFLELVSEEESLRLMQVKILGELAKLRGMPLLEVAAQMGLKSKPIIHG